MAQYFQGFSLGAGSVKTYHLDIDNDLSFNNHKLTNLGNPTNNTDGARKQEYNDIMDKITWQLVFETTTSTPTTTITISGLDINTDKKYRLYMDLINNSGYGRDYYLFVNGDTQSSNYVRQKLTANNSTITAEGGNDSRFAINTSSGHLIYEFDIIKDKYSRFKASYTENQTSYSSITFFNIYKTATISNITSLTIYAPFLNGTYGIDTNSYVSLYRLRGY